MAQSVLQMVLFQGCGVIAGVVLGCGVVGTLAMNWGGVRTGDLLYRWCGWCVVGSVARRFCSRRT
ncbi:MAG: hypothetical protein H0W02_10775 [Ktedonobacteraceae bacterium]|nr:hypothetical protein [Ktedonobacteraceae bacterium]